MARRRGEGAVGRKWRWGEGGGKGIWFLEKHVGVTVKVNRPLVSILPGNCNFNIAPSIPGSCLEILM
jgi:hypothetical protein